MVIIPVDPSVGFFTEKVTLGGKVFTIECRWNARMARWIGNVLDANEVPLLMGQPLMEGWPILQRFAIKGLPAADIMAFDMNNMHQEANTENFGADVLLLYTGD